MGVIERGRYIVNADLELLLRRGRDPQLVLEGYLEDLEAVLDETRQIRRGQEAEMELLLGQGRDVRAAMNSLQQKARRCLELEDEELARAALSRKLDMESQLSEIEEQVQEHRRNLELLDDSIAALEARLQQVQKTRRRLRLRRQLLEARGNLQEAVARVKNRDEHLFGEAAERLAEMEGMLDAEALVASEDLDNRFRRQEQSSDRQQRQQRLERELEQLKKQLKLSGESKNK
jgi:phage shock protein A